jgi:hypothetical protein
MDPVEKLKKKMVSKLREAGVPETAVEAVDLLTPDDVEDLGMTAAAALIPGGAAVKTASKVTRKVIPVARAAGEKAASKAGHAEAMRALEKAGREAGKDLDAAILTGASSIPLMVTEASAEDFEKEFNRLKAKREAKKALRRKDMVP